jgi:hypothetical protein
MSFSPDSRILQVEITTEEANLRSRTIAGAGLHVRREMKEDEEVANNMSPTISRIVGQVGEDNTTVTSRSILFAIQLLSVISQGVGCGPGRTRVARVCVARTTIRHTWRAYRSGY